MRPDEPRTDGAKGAGPAGGGARDGHLSQTDVETKGGPLGGGARDGGHHLPPDQRIRHSRGGGPLWMSRDHPCEPVAGQHDSRPRLITHQSVRGYVGGLGSVLPQAGGPVMQPHGLGGGRG
jgi:hypothetical protein